METYKSYQMYVSYFQIIFLWVVFIPNEKKNSNFSMYTIDF